MTAEKLTRSDNGASIRILRRHQNSKRTIFRRIFRPVDFGGSKKQRLVDFSHGMSWGKTKEKSADLKTRHHYFLEFSKKSTTDYYQYQQMGLEGGGGRGTVRTYSGRTVCTVRIYNTYLYATLSDQ